MQRPSTLHGTLGSYLRHALQEGSATVVTGLHVHGAKVFPSFLLFARVDLAMKSRFRTHEYKTETMRVLSVHISW
jgi:hypothetical protein